MVHLGLVEPTLLSDLKRRISEFSVSQQDLLRVATEDIFFSFPYQIGIIIPDSQEDPGMFIMQFRYSVKLIRFIFFKQPSTLNLVRLLLHKRDMLKSLLSSTSWEGWQRFKGLPKTRRLLVLSILQRMKKTNLESWFAILGLFSLFVNVGTKMNASNKYINFRFFRDFTQGTKDPTWIINWINQFLPAEAQRN